RRGRHRRFDRGQVHAGRKLRDGNRSRPSTWLQSRRRVSRSKWHDEKVEIPNEMQDGLRTGRDRQNYLTTPRHRNTCSPSARRVAFTPFEDAVYPARLARTIGVILFEAHGIFAII